MPDVTPQSGAENPLIIPRILHYTAPTKHLRPEERRLMRRARQIMPEWDVRLWDDNDNLALVAELNVGWVDNFLSARHGVIRADIARYLILYRYGGFYIDTDYKVLRPFDDAVLPHACILPESRPRSSPDGFRLGNAVMGSAPGLRLWWHFVSDIFERDLSRVTEGQIESLTGPEGLTGFYLRHGEYHAQIGIPSKHLFHPQITKAGLGAATQPDTYGIHLCYGSWRTKNHARRIKNQLVRYFTSI